jgi:hypothetical protein
MSQTWNTPNHSSDDVPDGFTIITDRTDSLRTCFKGPSAPSSPVEGDRWLDDSGTPYVMKLYADFDGGGATWHEIAVLTQLSSDMECSFQQLKEARVENLGGHETPASGKDGHVYYLTGEGELYFVDFSVDNSVKKLLAIQVGTDTDRLDLPLSDAMLDDTNPPTEAEKGSTPTIRGYLFDATNEKMTFGFKVPQNYSADGDATLRLAAVLNQAETNGDDIDWSADVIAGAAPFDTTKTSTAAAASLTDIGTDSADGRLHECDITLDYDDATNPIAAGSWVFVTIYRTNLTEVGGVIVVAAHVVYPAKAGLH